MYCMKSYSLYEQGKSQLRTMKKHELYFTCTYLKYIVDIFGVSSRGSEEIFSLSTQEGERRKRLIFMLFLKKQEIRNSPNYQKLGNAGEMKKRTYTNIANSIGTGP